MRKSHECHSEPQAKNLAFPATHQNEILRLSPQDHIATHPWTRDEGGGSNVLNDRNDWTGLNLLVGRSILPRSVCQFTLNDPD
jgi:hypothetical protein